MSIIKNVITTALPILPKVIIGQVVRRYISGATLADSIQSAQYVYQKKMIATVDVLS